MALTVGSLFSGIGGLDIGLERAGMEIRWQVENDDYCNRVLEKHWPEIPRYRDIRELRGDELEPVDLICGGFPCQDLSYAGKRAGLEGDRSGLWFEMLRLLGVLRPKYVIVENVPGILNGGIDVVLGGLALCGYDAGWDCISAASVGAFHRRDRIFIVAHAESSGYIHRPTEKLPADGGESPLGGAISGGPNVPDTQGERGQCGNAWNQILGPQCREELSGWYDTGRSTIWAAEPDVGRVADGVPSRLDRLKGLGNAVVPQVAEFIGRRIMGAEE